MSLHRVVVRLTADEKATVHTRARLHGLSLSAYVRGLIFGRRPGATPGTETAAADAWWDSLPPQRRAQVFRWIEQAKNLPAAPQPGQLSIEESLTA